MMKNKLGIVKQIHLTHIPVENWLKVRKKVKESKCENCKKLHKDEKFIVSASVEGRTIAHICKDCGEYFLKNGATDIMLLKQNNEMEKEKLIKQAERLGHRFGTSPRAWSKMAENYNITELKDLIKRIIKNERQALKNFLSFKHRDTIENFCIELNKEKYYKDVKPFDLFKKIPDIFYEYDSDTDYDHHRWCSYFTATIKIGDKNYSYQWANANGDNNLEDAGFDVDSVWETLCEIEKTLSSEERVQKQYNDALELCKKLPVYIEYKDQINNILKTAVGLK